MIQIVVRAFLLGVLVLMSVREIPAQIIELATPKGGEVFSQGDVVPIVWIGIPKQQPVTLQYTTDDGLTWQLIADAVVGGSYLWRIPSIQGALCRVRASTSGHLSVTKALTASGFVNGLEFSPDGSLLVDITQSSTVDVWSVRTGESVRSFLAHARLISHCDFSPDGKKFATSSLDGSIALWNTDAWALIHRMIPLTTYSVLDVRFSPDGSEIAAAYVNDTIRIWDVATGTVRLAIGDDPGASVHSVEYSRDGKRIFSALSNGKVNVWNASDGTLITTLIGHTRQVNMVRVSPDGSMIATASYDSTAIIWDATTYARLRTLTGSSGWIYSIEFDPSGQRVLTANKDSLTRIWRVSDGVLLDTLRHAVAAASGMFSPDNRLVATGALDGTVEIWGPPEGLSPGTFIVTDCEGRTIRGDDLRRRRKVTDPDTR